MSKFIDARELKSFQNSQEPSSSSTSSPAITTTTTTPPQTQAQGHVSTSSGIDYEKRKKSVSSVLTSPQKKASPSDVIFGKPPGTDSASRAYDTLNADSGSSGEGSSGGSGVIQPTSAVATKMQIEYDSESTTSQSASSSSSSDRHRHTPSSRPATSATSARSQSIAEAGIAIDHDSRVLPPLFEDADSEDIVELVADMLTRLTVHNDQLPLHPTSLTRFHSRATPSISVLSYLKRISKYTSLEKACTLILLVYIDRVCERISGFTICSLTVHRFICAAVVCASKALCDSFSTNGHYARVGGISLVELNMLEKELLNIIDWKLSCSGSLLQHYYSSLITYRSTSSQAGTGEGKDGESSNMPSQHAEDVDMTSSTVP